MKKIIKKKPKTSPLMIARISIIVLSCLFIVTIMQWERGFLDTGFREGDIALRDIFAPYDFSIQGDVNIKATEKLKMEAMESVYPIIVYDKNVKTNLLKESNKFKDAIIKLKDTVFITDSEKDKKIADVAASFNVSRNLVKEVLSTDITVKLFEIFNSFIDKEMSKAILSQNDIDLLREKGVEKTSVLDNSKNPMGIKILSDYQSKDNITSDINAYSSQYDLQRDKKETLKQLIDEKIVPNSQYDQEETKNRRIQASEEVKPVYNLIEVKKNERIINKGERINKYHINKLNGMEKEESDPVKLGSILGTLLIICLFCLLFSLYLRYCEPKQITLTKDVALISIIVVFIIAIAKVIVISPWPSSLIPIAVASMLLAILLNSRTAIIVTVFLSLLIGVISGNRLDIATVSILGGMVGIYSVRGIRKRTQLLQAGISVGFVYMSYFVAIGLIRGLDYTASFTESLFGFINGFASAIIVTGILPLFENTFKITTDISLLELSDLNHPILKEMVIKAPGTYHHSLVVGNIAEAACEAIGANPLLARVGSYFHDIGKIEKASYFSENQMPGDSTHDKLSPTMSSLIITSHVKNGVEMAKEYNLNKEIRNIIEQHHGTGLVFYFFKRALEKGVDEQVGEEAFRYPGPKPQTKEAACVLLADSVEAASRTLEEPTPSRIKGLVRKIINNKFIDGQLDECDLTLRDLEKIAEVFSHILTGIFHTRIEYPEENNNKKVIKDED